MINRRPRYYRKVIHIRAVDSPNVRFALAQIERGEEPTGEVLVPGVLSWDEYQKRRRTLDSIEQSVILDAEFYKGPELFLFPDDVLWQARQAAEFLIGRSRQALSMGVDSAEGGDSTSWTITDMLGMIHQYSAKTKDTSVIVDLTIEFIKEYRLNPEMVLFDRGGGGLEHAHQLRRRGYDVRTVGFGESATDPHKDRKTSTIKAPVKDRVDRSESKYAYKNRRTEMYARTAELFNRPEGFAVDAKYKDVIKQLKVIPKDYDQEGRLKLPPKDKPHPNYTGVTMKGLLGRSPDEADSLVLAVFGMMCKLPKVMVGAI